MDEFVHLPGTPFLFVGEDLQVECDMEVGHIHQREPALFYTLLHRVPGQQRDPPVVLQHSDEKRGVAALQKRE